MLILPAALVAHVILVAGRLLAASTLVAHTTTLVAHATLLILITTLATLALVSVVVHNLSFRVKEIWYHTEKTVLIPTQPIQQGKLLPPIGCSSFPP